VTAQLLLLLISSIVILALGLLVFSRNPHLTVNRIYVLFSVMGVGWMSSSYLTDHAWSIGAKLIFAKLAFFIGYLTVFFVYVFAWYFPNTNIPSRLTRISAYAATIIMAIICIDRGVVASVTPGNQSTNVKPGSLYLVFIACFIYVFVLILVKMIVSYKRAKGVDKAKLIYLQLGVGFAIAWGVMTNVILPGINAHWRTPTYGPFGILVLMAMVTTAMIRHKLFDIRLIVARSIAYIFTFTVMAFLFITPTVLVSIYLLHSHLDFATTVIFVLITFLIAISFQFLRNTFNKLTNKIFFRDYYEIQDILDKLGNLLVGSVDLEEIKSHSTITIVEAIKPNFFEYILVADKDPKRRELLKHLQHSSSNLLVHDELDSLHNRTIYAALDSNNIAMAVRLRTTTEDLGFIILGYKQSGTIYSEKDKRLLTIAADEIAISLQNALRFREIQAFNETLQQKINEATKQLSSANDKLKIMDSTKDDFISMASHQLRTPLTSIKGYVSMVLEGDAGKISKMQEKFLSQALTSSSRMANLVSDLLNVSRMESGKFFIDAKPVNLADLAESIVNELSESAKAKGVALIYNKPSAFSTVMLDEDKTSQVIINFIDNALHYAKNMGKVEVIVKDNADSVELRVVDDGIGVPLAVQKDLFTKFFRAENAKKARPDGTGIGLYLAKRVISSQNGTIIFESQENKGSTFGFTFPKKSETVKNPKIT
jgi:signal transduction histidine kinase